MIRQSNVQHKVIAALACRAESTRLFGKPLQLLGNRPVMAHLIERFRRIEKLDDIVLAISDGPSTELFVNFAREYDLRYVIGSGRDVLGRIITAADHAGADIVLRNTTENAFLYWENVDELIARHIENGNDLTVTEQLPIAAFVEVISVAALRRAHQMGEDRHRSEFVTLFIAENPDLFRIERVAAPEPLRRPRLRLAIDGPEDLIALRAIYEAIGGEDGLISLEQVVRHVDANPELAEQLDAGDILYLWK